MLAEEVICRTYLKIPHARVDVKTAMNVAAAVREEKSTNDADYLI